LDGRSAAVKILYLCPDLGIPVLGRKGAAVHVRQLVAAFSRAGHQVVLAAQLLNKSPWEKPAEFSTPILQIHPSVGAGTAIPVLKAFNELLGSRNSIPGEIRRILYNQDFEMELRRRFEADPPDFIYERASLYSTAGVSLAQALRRPILVELNAPLAVEQSAYRATGLGELAAQAEAWTLQQAQAVIVVSAQLREHVLNLGVDASRIHVLPNGVDPARFHPAAPDPAVRARWGLDGQLVIGFVGGLRPWHGVEILPELVERLAARFPAIRLVIAGDGPLRSDLERSFGERGLQSRVLFTGLLPHEEMPAIIRQFDVALAPYPQPEHAFYFSPLKLFEYMACGIPVVAAGLGQIAEIIRAGETGLLYSPGDLDQLAAQCERLLADANLRQAMGRQAAAVVGRQFTWDHNAARVVQLASALSLGA
jgi:glycosyltransferase involved in cell wall biosynthesis